MNLQFITYQNLTVRDFCVGDIVAINNTPVRIVGIISDIYIQYLNDERTGTYKTTVSEIQDIRINEETLLKNGFQNLGNHTLMGPQWKLTSPTDEKHWIEIRVGEFISGKYLDDSVYENFMTRHALSLRELQHAFNMDKMNKILQL